MSLGAVPGLRFIFPKEGIPIMVFKSGKLSEKKRLDIVADDNSSLVPIVAIRIVERPQEGHEHEKLFFNPRDLTSFTPEEMEDLLFSVRVDGLQNPLVVRAINEGGTVSSVELISGERRLRVLQRIYEEDQLCFDEQSSTQSKKWHKDSVVIHRGHFAKVLDCADGSAKIQFFNRENQLIDAILDVPATELLETISGKQLYEKVPCRVHYNCDDERALGLAFIDNDKHRKFQPKEEIALVERLLRSGLKQGQVAEVLRTNETWVSHTLSFREKLPQAAFQKLLDGGLTRNVAVSIMSYPEKDRKALFAATLEVAAQDNLERIERHEVQQIQNEDAEDLALHDQKKAEEIGDAAAAKKAKRKAKAAHTKASKAKISKDRAVAADGHVKQSHVQKAAAKTGIKPKKAKFLSKEEVLAIYIDEIEQYLDGDQIDPICGEDIPADYVAIMRGTAQAILEGERDPLAVIRNFMVDDGRWIADNEPIPAGVIKDDDDFDFGDAYDNDNDNDDDS